MSETKSTSIEFRLTPSQAAAVANAAAIGGERVSSWCRAVVVREAQRLARRHVAVARELVEASNGS